MAFYKNNYRRNKYRARKKSAQNLKKFAYQLGKVNQGLQRDTQVRDAYNRGAGMKPRQYVKKDLY